MSMETKGTSELRIELKRSAEDIRLLEVRKDLIKVKIKRLEKEIKEMKEHGEVPKKIWAAENELAEITRNRNALAEGQMRARVREQGRMQALKRIEDENRRALEMKRPRKTRR